MRSINWSSGKRRRRRGYTLVIFVLLVFGILALAAVVIDVGFARLAQRQMKTATDTAALEGLRGRNRDMLDATVTDPDGARRLSASEFAALMFDDDLQPAAGDPRNFGAGPRVELTGGVGDPSINASQLLTVPASPVYKPQQSGGTAGLELNAGNELHGDLVAGDYSSSQDHSETASYARSDFDPLAAVPGAFLARMRRTNNFQSLDQLAGVSSAGPALPLLFGRGALLPAGDPSAGYSPRHHGISVRATSIAQARRVQAVGAASAADDLPGALPLVIYRSAWESGIGSPAANLEVNTSGELLSGATVVGFVLHAGGVSETTSLGDAVALQATASPALFVGSMLNGLPSAAVAYVAVVADSTDPQIPGRVIGFGMANAITEDAMNPNGFVFQRGGNVVAYENASAVAATPLDSVFRDTPDDPEFNALWQQHRQLSAPLLAPVLAR